MNKDQLKNLIERVLKQLDLYNEDAVNLLLGTAAQESHLGEYIRQLGNGPALGIFQMEPATFRDIMVNYLKYKPDLGQKIIALAGTNGLKSEYLEFNLVVAIAFARLHYLRVSEKIPNTIDGYARYWKVYYNTCKGKGTEQEFIENYKRFVL